ncbi:MAG: hypothetical protein JO255_18870 [Alphaproteobacteria bacterium]|nr:hypothetical protein [Alphaproteobacteria bacterium]
MRAYRCCFLDARDMISLVEIIEADSDEDALRQAADRLAKKPVATAVEVWDLARLVDKLLQDDGGG